MYSVSQMLGQLFWPAVILFALILAAAVAVAFYAILFGKREKDLSVYEKREYLFDTKNEFELFKVLNEVFADRFYVFPQVGYSHVIQVRKGLPERERFIAWNSINRKTADFVLCDKVRIVPQLVIELDGSSHQMPARVERDSFINKLMGITSLPILHLTTTNFDKEYIRGEVEKALAQK